MRLYSFEHYLSTSGTPVTAFVTSIEGGVSEGLYKSLNPCHYVGDSEDAVKQNREIICNHYGLNIDSLIIPTQSHTDVALVVDEEFLALTAEERNAKIKDVDAVITNIKGVTVGVSSADCLTALCFDKKQNVIAAVHAGWRGTQNRILTRTIEKMIAVFGSDPKDIAVVFGPCIKSRNYIVGKDVYNEFSIAGFNMSEITKPADGEEQWYLDMVEANYQNLEQTGITREQVFVDERCTFEENDLFSARRLGIASGRLLTAIVLK